MVGKVIMKPVINPDKCVECADCIEICTEGVLGYLPSGIVGLECLDAVHPENCIGCEDCVGVCTFGAIELVE